MASPCLVMASMALDADGSADRSLALLCRRRRVSVDAPAPFAHALCSGTIESKQ
jgi:hypothetical protein